MAVAKVTQQGNGAPQAPPPPPTVDEQFNFTLTDGSVVTVGKPRGVLKLKLRDILTEEQFKDNEIKEIGRAFLSVRTIDGYPIPMRNPEHFEALLNRFGDDDAVDAFMNEWQKLVNPVMHGVVAKALQEALDKGLTGAAVEVYVTERVMEEARGTLEKVKA